jgi:hypothetical protein
MWKWSCLFIIVLLGSCKSKAALVPTEPVLVMETPVQEALPTITPAAIIQHFYDTKNDFSTLYIKASARYSDPNSSQNVSADIKIQRGEKILISLRFLGITMAKALITPSEVKYYEKINGNFFEGNYQVLSEWLGTDLDYTKIQNLLLGQPIDHLTAESFTMMLMDKTYKLSSITPSIEKSFYLDQDRYFLKKQEITQPEKQRTFDVSYPNYQEYALGILPQALEISAVQEKGKTEISIEYNSISINEELTFPYSVPEGYERIYIN